MRAFSVAPPLQARRSYVRERVRVCELAKRARDQRRLMVRKGGGENKEGGRAEAVIKTGMLITLCITEKPVIARWTCRAADQPD